jgi:hypothetical protein
LWDGQECPSDFPWLCSISIARIAVFRVRPSGRRRLLRTDDAADGLIDGSEIGRHFVADFVGEASAFEDIGCMIADSDVLDDRFALQFRLDEFFEVVDFRQQIVFEVIDQLFGELFGVIELLA